MKVRFKKLHPEAITPKYAKNGDAAMDLTAISEAVCSNSTEKGSYFYREYKTGLSIEIPEGYVGLIFPRSSISDTGLLLSNSVGVIDSGFRGEIKFRFKLDGMPNMNYKKYEVGDRIGQLLIIPYPQIELEEVNELSESDRGTGGFGSSGQ